MKPEKLRRAGQLDGEIDWSPIELTPEELSQVRDCGAVRPSGDPWWHEASKPVLAFIKAKHRSGVTLKDLRSWVGVTDPPTRGSRPLPWRILEESVYWLNLRELVTITSEDGEIRIRATGRG
jgi:hypothetical protein